MLVVLLMRWHVLAFAKFKEESYYRRIFQRNEDIKMTQKAHGLAILIKREETHETTITITSVSQSIKLLKAG